ncbi:MAG: succinylglutamate desuccinylase/aspartoacylase family protein [Lentisphaerae bacterium]|nr:succinylglutamate desuccinylase/aspartoacylase family protein [Lentisphaerota bacterium]
MTEGKSTYMHSDDCPFADLPPGAHKKTFEIPLEPAPPLTVSVHVIKGAAPGPVFMAMAGEHGNELNGVAAVDTALSLIDWRELRGTVIGIPVLNPRNVEARNHCHGSERGKPYGRGDAYNTAFAWPGRPNGSPAERIASHLLAHALPLPDIFVNVHGMTALAASAVFAMTPGAEDERLALSFGLHFTYVTADPLPLDGRLAPLFASQGASAFVVELSGQWWLDRRVIDRGARGIVNMLCCRDMLPGEIDVPPEQYLVRQTEGEHVVRSPGPGLFIPAIDHARPVRKDDVLGRLLDVHTLDRTDIISPADGAVWFAARFGPACDTRLEDLHAFADANDMLAIVKPVQIVRNSVERVRYSREVIG